jgi:hypothetical protein
MSRLQSKHKILAAALFALAAGAIGLGWRGARAAGVPTMNPLYYAGFLQDGAGPVNGAKNLELVFWDSETSTSSANRKCTTTASATMVTSGRFRVPLDPTCVTDVHASPDLWIEVRVDGTSLGRRKIGASAFAVEAGSASAAAGDLATKITQRSPPGSMIAYAGPTAPGGWLLCDGTAVPRTGDNADLFAAIGTSWGSGDGTTTFNVPDLRGRFLRGVSHAVTPARDPNAATRTASNPGGNAGDAVGSVQGGATALPATAFSTNTAGDHNHSSGGYTRVGALVGDLGGVHLGHTPSAADAIGNENDIVDSAIMVNAGSHTHTIGGGDGETRPVNAYVNFIIKL